MTKSTYQVHVRHCTPDGAPVFTPKTELADEFAELTAGAKETEKVVLKQHPSSFTRTDLAEHLDKLGKKKIVLAGIHSYTSPAPPCQLRTTYFRTRADVKGWYGLGYMVRTALYLPILRTLLFWFSRGSYSFVNHSHSNN